jgi:hypothetical protein
MKKLINKILREDFDWTENVGPLQGFKFRVNHNDHTYVVDDDGSDTLGVRIVGDDDYHSTITRKELERNLFRRLWHDAKTYKFNPNLKIREDFDWAQETQINWSTFYNEILENVKSLPESAEDVTEEMVMSIWMKLDPLTKQAEENSNLEHKNLMTEIWYEMEYLIRKVGRGTLANRTYDITRNLLMELLGQLIGRLRSINEDFDWTSQADVSPNYKGHPQGVVHLRTHDEIKEFFDIVGNSYGVEGKRGWNINKTISDFHGALEQTRDRVESDDWDGYDDWIPAISASFFISKKDPTKYDTGYWDYDVQEDCVEDWLVNEGCEEEVIDCENWKIYTDISQLRTLFKDYTGELLHKTKSGKPLKVGDKVKVIDSDSDQYGETLEIEHLVGGDGYEKHGGAFQTIEYDTRYFAGYEVEHVEDLTEDFDWTKNVPNPGKYDLYDLQGLILTRGINIGDKVHLKGHARDIDMVFDNVGTVSDVMEINNKYLDDDGEDELEYAIKIRFKEDILHGKGYDGMDIPEYELNDGFADQDHLTFDIVN